MVPLPRYGKSCVSPGASVPLSPMCSCPPVIEHIRHPFRLTGKALTFCNRTTSGTADLNNSHRVIQGATRINAATRERWRRQGWRAGGNGRRGDGVASLVTCARGIVGRGNQNRTNAAIPRMTRRLILLSSRCCIQPHGWSQYTDMCSLFAHQT